MKLAAVLFAALAACASLHAAPVEGPARRIVSLMPSLTEDLCAIGARSRIVGVSAYSSDIGCVRGVPQVGNAASVDAESILRLHADAVVGIPPQGMLMEPVRRAGVRTVLLSDNTYDDIFTDIDRLGALTGRAPQARELIAHLRSRTAQLRRMESRGRAPRVFVVIQAQPIWTVGPGSYISTLLELAGARNAVASLPQPYAQYSAEALVRTAPDAIVATSDSELSAALARPPWNSLAAVRKGRVYILRDDAILVRPGPRYNEGLAWLIERLTLK